MSLAHHFRVRLSAAYLVGAMTLLTVARGGEPVGRVRVLIDASKDGGVWWFPQAPPRFVPSFVTTRS